MRRFGRLGNLRLSAGRPQRGSGTGVERGLCGGVAPEEYD